MQIDRALPILLVLAFGSADAFAYAFTRIADTSTPIPGGTGNFTSFDPAAAGGIDGIVFRGFGAGGQEGIYRAPSSASVQRLIDRNIVVPGTSGAFTTIGTPSSLLGPVYFQGGGGGRTGIYRADGTAVDVIDDGLASSVTFGRVASSGTRVAYLRNGVVISNRTGVLAPETFNVGVNITSFGDPDIGQQFGTPLGVRINYVDGEARSGLLYSDWIAPDRILFPAVPGTTGEVSVNWSGAAAVIQAGTGVQVNPSFGMFPELVPLGYPIPGGTGGFTGFRDVAAGSPNLGLIDTTAVFVGLGGGGQEGIYYLRSGGQNLHELISRGNSLDGRIVDRLDIGRDSELGVAVTFRATFADGSSGIYFTSIPEPTCIPLLPALLGFVALRLRRTRAGRTE